MVGQVPRTAPPAIGQQYNDNQARQQRLEQAMVGGDLNRRAGMMNNIISNAPNIAALSGVGTIDQLANQFADAEAPIFNNQYGQTTDALRLAGMQADIAAKNRSGRGGGGSKKGDNGVPAGANVNPDDMLVTITDPNGKSVTSTRSIEWFKLMGPQLEGQGYTVTMDPFGFENDQTNITTKPATPNVTAQGNTVVQPPASNTDAADTANATPVVPAEPDPTLDAIKQRPGVADAVPNGDGTYTVTLDDGEVIQL